MKTFILTLVLATLLGVTMAWGQDYKADITGLDSLKITHNPDYEYFETFEKCDTTWCILIEDINNLTIMALICGDRVIHKIDCYTDTIWADKINVWLTPDEHKRLMELLQKGLTNADIKWLNMAKQDLETLKEMEALYQQVKDRLK